MSRTGDLIQALAFAAAKHRDQRRKDVCASPYINHPIQLVDVLCNEAGVEDINVLTGAILHDTIEDTGTTVEDIRALFGEDIAFLVESLTKLSKMEFKTSEDAQAENFRKMFLAMA